MASVVRSSVHFVRGTWGALIAAFAAITDPLGIAKVIGAVPESTHWIIGETGMRAVFLAFAVAWAFVWFHGVQKEMERGQREANMPLHQALRWIARDSVWASKYRWPDDQWVVRVQAEFLSKWQLGRFEMIGQDRRGNSGLTYLPPALKGSAEFHGHMLTGAEPPTHIWSKEVRTPDGLPTCFYEVKVDRREIAQVWPRRSLLARLLRKSPVERIDAEGYREIFRKQDVWYSKNYSLPGTPLDWIFGEAG